MTVEVGEVGSERFVGVISQGNVLLTARATGSLRSFDFFLTTI